MSDEVVGLYHRLKGAIQTAYDSTDASDILRDICRTSVTFLAPLERRKMTSLVAGKEYFCFGRNGRRSRPINQDLYVADCDLVAAFLDSLATDGLGGLSATEITRACYALAISFCAVIDLTNPGDQKTPGTFFEYMIGHLVSRRLGVLPKKRLDVLNLDMQTSLPTDLIFDLGANQPKFHVPVKTSTRERVVQVWAHQKVLDGVYGTGRFLGLLMCLAETKADSRSLQVTEICLPDQWRVYQLFIAQMRRVYYLDIPTKYAELNEVFPRIRVKSLGEFFLEADALGAEI